MYIIYSVKKDKLNNLIKLVLEIIITLLLVFNKLKLTIVMIY